MAAQQNGLFESAPLRKKTASKSPRRNYGDLSVCLIGGESSSCHPDQDVKLLNSRLRPDRKIRESENEVELRIGRYLARRGWRPHRNHVGLFKTLKGELLRGEPEGFPDWLYARANPAGVLYVETKASGEKPTAEQLRQIEKLTALGYLATWCDSVQQFDRWYRSVGLDAIAA